MAGFSTEIQGTNSYLVYQFSDDDVIDELSKGQITANAIAGLAPASFSQSGSDRYIKYNVTAKVSLTQLLAGIVGRKRFIKILNGIVDGLISAGKYAIDINTIRLEKDYIFSDVATFETVLICIPAYCRTKSANTNLVAHQFFKDLLFTTTYDQSENLDFVTALLSFLNLGEQAFSVTGLKEILQRIEHPTGASQERSILTDENNRCEPVKERENATNRTYNPDPQPYTPLTPQKPENNPVNTEQPQQPAKPAEKMTWFYLMCHYSKKNQKLYDEQKKQGSNKNKDNKKNSRKDRKYEGIPIPGEQDPLMPPKQEDAEQRLPNSTGDYSYQSRGYQPQVPCDGTMSRGVKGFAGNFGDTTVLGETRSVETTVLKQTDTTKRSNPCIIRERNNERIPIDKSMFRIGSQNGYADYCISDNPAISHGHACITREKDELYLMDTNSKNHTWVNGSMIQGNMKIKLKDGDSIRLANEDFTFRLY